MCLVIHSVLNILCVQIGSELVGALRQRHGNANVIATDIRYAIPSLAQGMLSPPITYTATDEQGISFLSFSLSLSLSFSLSLFLSFPRSISVPGRAAGEQH